MPLTPAPLRIESRRTSRKSPPASHIANPRRPVSVMYAPLAANARASSNETWTWDVALYTYAWRGRSARDGHGQDAPTHRLAAVVEAVIDAGGRLAGSGEEPAGDQAPEVKVACRAAQRRVTHGACRATHLPRVARCHTRRRPQYRSRHLRPAGSMRRTADTRRGPRPARPDPGIPRKRARSLRRRGRSAVLGIRQRSMRQRRSVRSLAGPRWGRMRRQAVHSGRRRRTRGPICRSS